MLPYMIESGKNKTSANIKFKKQEFKSLKIENCLKKLLSHPNICDKQWIWDQYDHTVMGDTIQNQVDCVL